MSSPILPRFHAIQERADSSRRVARAILESGGSAETAKTVARATLAGDEKRLRGLPAIGRGVSGALPGTDPVAELMRKQPR